MSLKVLFALALISATTGAITPIYPVLRSAVLSSSSLTMNSALCSGNSTCLQYVTADIHMTVADNYTITDPKLIWRVGEQNKTRELRCFPPANWTSSSNTRYTCNMTIDNWWPTTHYTLEHVRIHSHHGWEFPMAWPLLPVINSLLPANEKWKKLPTLDLTQKGKPDFTPPQLVSVTVSPISQKVKYYSDVDINAVFIDTGSGISAKYDSMELIFDGFYCTTGEGNPKPGRKVNLKCAVEVDFQNSHTGHYPLTEVHATDITGNILSLKGPNLLQQINKQLPKGTPAWTHLPFFNLTVNNDPDNTPPVINSIEFTSTSLTVNSDHPDTEVPVSMILSLTDAGTGLVTPGNVWFGNTDRTPTQNFQKCEFHSRINNHPRHFKINCTVMLNAWLPSGTYSMASIYFGDESGNSVTGCCGEAPMIFGWNNCNCTLLQKLNDALAPGVPKMKMLPSFQVTQVGKAADTEPPILWNVTLRDTVVGHYDYNYVKGWMWLKDDQSGPRYPRYMPLNWLPNGPTSAKPYWTNTYTSATEDPHNITFGGSWDIILYFEEIEFSMAGYGTIDNAGNWWAFDRIHQNLTYRRALETVNSRLGWEMKNRWSHLPSFLRYI